MASLLRSVEGRSSGTLREGSASCGSRSAVLACTLLVALLLQTGCSSSKKSATTDETGTQKNQATISANPNPVPAGESKFGATTITWDTGDGSVGQVYVSVNGREEQLFADNRPKGSNEAKFIGKAECVFRLYAGKEHKRVLASVTVTRNPR